MRPICWIDGKLRPVGEAAIRADDSSYREGRGCYTTARFEGGCVRFGARHARRLRRDAATLGLGELDETLCRNALDELGRAAFGTCAGALRLQASRDAEGSLHLVGLPRALGDEPSAWKAILGPFPHPGLLPWSAAKVTGQPFLVVAREAARSASVEEAILLDHAGWLVEGARSNLFMVEKAGRLLAPPLERGSVEGVGREIVMQAVPEIVSTDIDRRALYEAQEIIGVNALRGAHPIVFLDAQPVGDGKPGPWVSRLGEALRDAE